MSDHRLSDHPAPHPAPGGGSATRPAPDRPGAGGPGPGLRGDGLWLPPLWAVLLLALVLRLAWAALVPVQPVSDPQAYHILAVHLVEYGVYGFAPDEPSAYWAVGPAALYAGAYLVFGIGGLAVVAVNLVSGLLAVWAVDRVGRGWFGDTMRVPMRVPIRAPIRGYPVLGCPVSRSGGSRRCCWRSGRR